MEIPQQTIFDCEHKQFSDYCLACVTRNQNFGYLVEARLDHRKSPIFVKFIKQIPSRRTGRTFEIKEFKLSGTGWDKIKDEEIILP